MHHTSNRCFGLRSIQVMKLPSCDDLLVFLNCKLLWIKACAKWINANVKKNRLCQNKSNVYVNQDSAAWEFVLSFFKISHIKPQNSYWNKMLSFTSCELSFRVDIKCVCGATKRSRMVGGTCHLVVANQYRPMWQPPITRNCDRSKYFSNGGDFWSGLKINDWCNE